MLLKTIHCRSTIDRKRHSRGGIVWFSVPSDAVDRDPQGVLASIASSGHKFVFLAAFRAVPPPPSAPSAATFPGDSN